MAPHVSPFIISLYGDDFYPRFKKHFGHVLGVTLTQCALQPKCQADANIGDIQKWNRKTQLEISFT